MRSLVNICIDLIVYKKIKVPKYYLPQHIKQIITQNKWLKLFECSCFSREDITYTSHIYNTEGCCWCNHDKNNTPKFAVFPKDILEFLMSMKVKNIKKIFLCKICNIKYGIYFTFSENDIGFRCIDCLDVKVKSGFICLSLPCMFLNRLQTEYEELIYFKYFNIVLDKSILISCKDVYNKCTVDNFIRNQVPRYCVKRNITKIVVGCIELSNDCTFLQIMNVTKNNIYLKKSFGKFLIQVDTY